MKKLLAVVLVIALVFSMTACNTSSDVVETVAPVVTAAPATESPVVTETPVATETPTETPVATETPSTGGGTKITVSLPDNDDYFPEFDTIWVPGVSFVDGIDYTYSASADDASEGVIAIADSSYTGTLTITGSDATENTSLDINMPNATVYVSGTFDNVTAITADTSFHFSGTAGKITLKGGRGVIEAGAVVTALEISEDSTTTSVELNETVETISVKTPVTLYVVGANNSSIEVADGAFAIVDLTDATIDEEDTDATGIAVSGTAYYENAPEDEDVTDFFATDNTPSENVSIVTVSGATIYTYEEAPSYAISNIQYAITNEAETATTINAEITDADGNVLYCITDNSVSADSDSYIRWSLRGVSGDASAYEKKIAYYNNALLPEVGDVLKVSVTATNGDDTQAYVTTLTVTQEMITAVSSDSDSIAQAVIDGFQDVEEVLYLNTAKTTTTDIYVTITNPSETILSIDNTDIFDVMKENGLYSFGLAVDAVDGLVEYDSTALHAFDYNADPGSKTNMIAFAGFLLGEAVSADDTLGVLNGKSVEMIFVFDGDSDTPSGSVVTETLQVTIHFDVVQEVSTADELTAALLVGGTIALADETTFSFDSAIATITKPVVLTGGENSVIEYTGSTNSIVLLTTTEDLYIDGITFKYNVEATTNNVGAIKASYGTDGTSENTLSIVNSTIDGFTKNAITVVGGTAVIENNTITAGYNESAAGNGIQVGQYASASIKNNVIGAYLSETQWTAVGALVFDGGSAVLDGNTFNNCQTAYSIDSKYSSGIAYRNATSIEVYDNNVFDNCTNTYTDGGSIFAEDTAETITAGFEAVGDMYLQSKVYAYNGASSATSYTLTEDLTVPAGYTLYVKGALTIDTNATLTVEEGATLSVSGTLTVNGSVAGLGEVVISAGGTVVANGTTFIGSTDDATLKLTEGTVTATLTESGVYSKVVIDENSVAIIPEGKTFYTGSTYTGYEFTYDVVVDGELTVAGLLRVISCVVDGEALGSSVTVNGTMNAGTMVAHDSTATYATNEGIISVSLSGCVHNYGTVNLSVYDSNWVEGSNDSLGSRFISYDGSVIVVAAALD